MLKITIIKNDASLVKNAQFLPMGENAKQNKIKPLWILEIALFSINL